MKPKFLWLFPRRSQRVHASTLTLAAFSLRAWRGRLAAEQPAEKRSKRIQQLLDRLDAAIAELEGKDA